MVAPVVEGIDLFNIADRFILPNTSYGVHDADTAAQTGEMTPEELERCFIQAVVDNYQQAWDPLRRQCRVMLWEFDSGIRLVECPNCARTRSLSPSKVVLRFPSHDKRKTRTPNTDERWAMEQTIWKVVGGESK